MLATLTLLLSLPLAVAAPAACGPDPFLVQLVPTPHANEASGTARMVFAESPFGVTVTADGSHSYRAHFETQGLGNRSGALVVWVATPSLDQVQKLGTLDDAGRLSGRVAFNKFIVFVTEEPNAEVERWTGKILLRGISPSGRMHSMAGHGPFATEACGGVFTPYSN